MDTIKALFNQILLSLDQVRHTVRRLPKKGKRRLLLLVSAFLLLVVLLILVFVSSCHGKDTASAVESPWEGTVEPEPTYSQPIVLTGDVQPLETESIQVTWPPEETVALETSQETPPPQEPEQQTAQAADTPAPQQQEPEAQEAEPQYDMLKKHDKSDAVLQLQYRLMDLGYLDIDEPTDYFGSSTEYGVMLFQRQHDLKQDGIAGNETQTILYSKDAEHYCLKEGAEGKDVKALQEQLVDLGYLDDKQVDHIYGAITLAAVEAFQKRNGLHVDGLAGEKTLALLYSDDAKISRELQKQLEEEAAAARKKATATPKTAKKATATPKTDTRIDKFISAAKSKLGCEYVLGDKGPNTFDCSGFVYWCLRQAGVSVTRLNAAGYSQKSSWKKIESISDLKKGDILFFRSDTNSSVNHTGIYIGSGTMIDASSGNGKVVKRSLSAYWKRNFVCARRPWNN